MARRPKEVGPVTLYYWRVWRDLRKRFYRLRERYREAGGLPTAVSGAFWYASMAMHSYAIARENPRVAPMEIGAIVTDLAYKPFARAGVKRKIKYHSRRAVINFLTNPERNSRKVRHRLIEDYAERLWADMSPKSAAYATAHTTLQEIVRKAERSKKVGERNGVSYRIAEDENHPLYVNDATYYFLLKYFEAKTPEAKRSIRAMMRFHGLDRRKVATAAFGLEEKVREDGTDIRRRRKKLVRDIRSRLSHLPDDLLNYKPEVRNPGRRVLEMASLAGAYSTYLVKKRGIEGMRRIMQRRRATERRRVERRRTSGSMRNIRHPH